MLWRGLRGAIFRVLLNTGFRSVASCITLINDDHALIFPQIEEQYPFYREIFWRFELRVRFFSADLNQMCQKDDFTFFYLYEQVRFKSFLNYYCIFSSICRLLVDRHIFRSLVVGWLRIQSRDLEFNFVMINLFIHTSQLHYIYSCAYLVYSTVQYWNWILKLLQFIHLA